MRIFKILTALAVANGAVVAFVGSTVDSLAPKSVEVVSRDAARHNTELATSDPILDKRISLSWLKPGLSVSGFALVVGVYRWAVAAYSVAKDCQGESGSFDCFFSLADLVVESMLVVWAAGSARVARSIEGLPIYAEYTLGNRTVGLHIPLNQTHPKLVPSLSMLGFTANWTRVATAYSNGVPTHELSFRHVPDRALGYVNDGSAMELRAHSVRDKTKRTLDNENDLYVDYM